MNEDGVYSVADICGGTFEISLFVQAVHAYCARQANTARCGFDFEMLLQFLIVKMLSVEAGGADGNCNSVTALFFPFFFFIKSFEYIQSLTPISTNEQHIKKSY